MKLLFIYSLFICSVIFSADDSFAPSASKIYMPFRERTLMTDPWKYVKTSASQEKQNHLLYEFARIPCSDQEYYKRRNEIAAAIFAGACVARVQKHLQELSCESLLPPVVLKGDIPLVHLLLVKGADVNECDLKGERAIYHAKTAYMAILLIRYKALDNLHDVEKVRIFQRIMWPDYEPALIKLYKGHEFNPALWKNNWLILRSLVSNPCQDMVKKAELIFDKMSCENVLKIICGKKAGSSKTLFDEIEYRRQKAKENGQPDVCAQLTKLHKFLSRLVECPICYEHMSPTSYKKTSCGHLFHLHCLANWTQQCLVDWQDQQKRGLTKDLRNDCPVCLGIMEDALLLLLMIPHSKLMKKKERHDSYCPYGTMRAL